MCIRDRSYPASIACFKSLSLILNAFNSSFKLLNSVLGLLKSINGLRYIIELSFKLSTLLRITSGYDVTPGQL